jgi:hypothetical protein
MSARMKRDRLQRALTYHRDMHPLEIAGTVIGGLTVSAITALVSSSRLRRWLHLGAAGGETELPVRLTCIHEDGFDPDSGPHEGLRFEVFNRSEKAVRIKGLGMKLWMSGPGGEWTEHEQARQHPPIRFPVWLQPNDGLEGYLDYESIADGLHDRGLMEQLGPSEPYVEVVGYGEVTGEIITAAHA